ncbi:hypothetical protein HJA82_29305 [Rhizobium bangladeshense]|uniref:hypothetical protein n=1 Tax=Rhizobium bangladeshense TaxID=1138189 RepID=UPI001C8350A3|nr:hypothetical protein [Rhizobium bangladeshense]MBX4911413.1 hypothetical protein [Rhizobium bangladeshense]
MDADAGLGGNRGFGKRVLTRPTALAWTDRESARLNRRQGREARDTILQLVILGLKPQIFADGEVNDRLQVREIPDREWILHIADLNRADLVEFGLAAASEDATKIVLRNLRAVIERFGFCHAHLS